MLYVFDTGLYESIQVYNRSQVSVYTTIDPLVIFQGNLLIMSLLRQTEQCDQCRLQQIIVCRTGTLNVITNIF